MDPRISSDIPASRWPFTRFPTSPVLWHERNSSEQPERGNRLASLWPLG